MLHCRRRTRCWLGALLALAQGCALAQPQSEAELKAQILWRALQFVAWPAAELAASQPRAQPPLQLCLLADGPLAQALRAWDGQALQGRRLVLRRADPGAAQGCHIAYVGGEGATVPPDATFVPVQGLLWVGDGHGLTGRGVMFNLQPQQGRIVFDIDLQAARRAGLDLNARLLRLARFVRMEGTP